MVWTDWTDKSLLYLRDLLLLHLLHSVLPLAAMACTTLQGSSLPPSVVTGHVTTSQRAPLDCCEGFWCLAGFEVLCARSAAASLFFNAKVLFSIGKQLHIDMPSKSYAVSTCKDLLCDKQQ